MDIKKLDFKLCNVNFFKIKSIDVKVLLKDRGLEIPGESILPPGDKVARRGFMLSYCAFLTLLVDMFA